MKKENLVEMTPAEAAQFMWKNLTCQAAFEIVLAWKDNGQDIAGVICRCALMNHTGRSTIIANTYGGGSLFAHEVSITNPKAGEIFQQDFEKYLRSFNADEILVYTKAQPMRATVTMSQSEFIKYVDEKLSVCTTIKFRTESGIPYTFCVTDFYADAPVAICNCAAGGSFFAHDVSNEAGRESFVEAFATYLFRNGITAVLVDY